LIRIIHYAEAREAVNGNEELLTDHFWDSEEAEQEYYAVGQYIVEAEEKLAEAQSRLLTVQAVYDCFAGGAWAVVRRFYSDTKENVLHNLNQALNPYWLPSDGRVKSDEPFTPGRGCLVVQKVESETVQAKVYYGRHKKRDRAYVSCWQEYSYEKRIEWYTPTGDAAMSGIEHSLRCSLSPYTPPNALCDKVLYNKLLEELIREAHEAFALYYEGVLCGTAGCMCRLPTGQEVRLKFIPDLAPTNTEEIYLSSGIYKEDVPKLEWPPLARYEAPKAGERIGLTSYKDIRCWLKCGRWEAYQFTPAQLEAVRERIEQTEHRLRERVEAADREVARIEEEINLLRKQRMKLRVLHYKPNEYKEFWSAMQTTERLGF
jgi:hypothetical protein